MKRGLTRWIESIRVLSRLKKPFDLLKIGL